MIPPTSIDGTDITGASIDGTDVQEITVDGQTVFTAETLPVAYSNLVGWYPFDSSFYGGANADDVTGLFNPGQSGDSTAYDGTEENSPSFSSNGVTDINAGANSGALDINGGNERINLGGSSGLKPTPDYTVCGWIDPDETSQRKAIWADDPGGDSGASTLSHCRFEVNGNDLSHQFEDSSENNVFNTHSATFTTGSWQFCAVVVDGGNEVRLYAGDPATNEETFSTSRSPGVGTPEIHIGNFHGKTGANAKFDDIRMYDTALSQSQLKNIYDNTEP